MPQIRCISDTGEQIGIVATVEALRMAESRGLDLVEISPNANPPVCRIMDFGKFRYEESRKEKLAKKHQASTVIKEVKFHVNVDTHDYQTKLQHIRGFLEKNLRVKTSLLFRGRENEHREFGFNLMNRLIKDCDGLGVPENTPKLFGNNLVMLMRPHRTGVKGEGAPPPSPPAAPPVAGRPPAPPVAAPRPPPPTPGTGPRPV